MVVYLHVGWDLVEIDSAVSLHVVLGVDLQVFVWVNWHQHWPNVRLQRKNRFGLFFSYYKTVNMLVKFMGILANMFIRRLEVGKNPKY